jgi:prolipoprotein diacylglyceryltransferase
MARPQAQYVALCAAAIGFALGFAWPAYAATSLFWYYPLERRWALEVRPSTLAIDWYGRCLLSTLIAAAAFGLVYLVARRLRPLTRRAYNLWAAWMVTAVLLAMSLYAYQLASRVPIPEPLPSWYQPR